MNAVDFQNQILNWHNDFGRHDLPWQQGINPYRVWLSEIMLQQTQVSTVIPYFQNFMTRFPTVKNLATAPLDEVLHLWTGLGYYARARNLHRCATIIVDQHDGQFPNTVETLSELPGIGRSTAGAIISIAFEQAAAILDGNVKRVLTRFYGITEWSGKTSTQKQLWQLAESLKPSNNTRQFSQAMMDLGATVCARSQPECTACPLKSDCIAHNKGLTQQIPASKPKKTLPVRQTHLLILTNTSGEILLEQRPMQGIWGGLYCLPEFSELDDLDALLRNRGITIKGHEKTKPFRHTFSHYHLDITPVHAKTDKILLSTAEKTTHLWYHPNKQIQVGLAAPVKKLLQEFIDD